MTDDATWTRLWDDLDRLVAPMTTAGWRVVAEHTDEDEHYGASVFLRLHRRGEPNDLEVELGEDHVDVWNASPRDEDEALEALLSIQDATPKLARQAFRARGWL